MRASSRISRWTRESLMAKGGDHEGPIWSAVADHAVTFLLPCQRGGNVGCRKGA